MKRVQFACEMDFDTEGYDSVAEARADANMLPPGKHYLISIVDEVDVAAPPQPTDNVVSWKGPTIKRTRKEASAE